MGVIVKKAAVRNLIIVMLLLLTFLAGAAGYASLQYNFAKNNLDLWVKSGKVTSQKSYLSSKKAIISANFWHSNNPVYLESQASILVWGVYAEFEDESLYQQALDLYWQSLQLRPMWPWAWSEWVMTKWRLKQYDEAMLNGLMKLSQYGPYTGEVHITVVDAGLQLMRKRPEFAGQIKPVVKRHYLRSRKNGHVRKQVKAAVESHENGAWLLE